MLPPYPKGRWQIDEAEKTAELGAVLGPHSLAINLHFLPNLEQQFD